MSVALAYGEFCEKMGAIKIEEHIFHHASEQPLIGLLRPYLAALRHPLS